MEIKISVRQAHGNADRLTMDDVWGKVDEHSLTLLTKGMIVARGLPQVDKYMTQAKRDEIISRTYPTTCPVWKDELMYKSVTVICEEGQVDEVSYWLEYVHGGGSISDIQTLPDGKVALRSNYMCW